MPNIEKILDGQRSKEVTTRKHYLGSNTASEITIGKVIHLGETGESKLMDSSKDEDSRIKIKTKRQFEPHLLIKEKKKEA